MPLYHIWTIGCQMNKAESERLGSLFEQIGYQPAASAEDADLILLNSCVIRQSAENKVVSKIGALKSLKKNNPAVKIALTGCLVDSHIDKLQKRFPIVDYFFAAGEMPPWIDKCLTANIIPLKPSVSTFINIIQGCNNFCSYCIVPYRRGREKSRPVDDIVSEAKTLVERGAKEIILVGQNVDSYGHDLPDKPDLAALLGEINKIDGLKRLRFLTNHPKDMSDRLIDAIANLDKVCEEINLPVQAGDDEILKTMRRGLYCLALQGAYKTHTRQSARYSHQHRPYRRLSRGNGRAVPGIGRLIKRAEIRQYSHSRLFAEDRDYSNQGICR